MVVSIGFHGRCPRSFGYNMATALRPNDDRGCEEPTPDSDGDCGPSAAKLVDLLGDEYTRQVLETIADEPMGGREIAEATAISRPTVYRRLNRLEEVGLVETQMELCPSGNHHKQFQAVLEIASFQLDGGELTASVRTEHTASDRRTPPERPKESGVAAD
jgi:DNA-binding transcriptional ArsR family regulator